MALEEWKWIRIRKSGEEDTYIVDKYERFNVINSKFANIKTLRDLRDNIEYITEDWRSPTGCFFGLPDTPWRMHYCGETDRFLNLPEDTVESVFYCDSQFLFEWEINSDGRISVQDRNKKIFVAHDLPEFLSRMDYENKCWYKEHMK